MSRWGFGQFGRPPVLVMVVKGQGLQRVRRTKSDAAHHTLPLPVFAVHMLERRAAASGGTGPLFPDSRGG
jgi:hypothetical protein